MAARQQVCTSLNAEITVWGIDSSLLHRQAMKSSFRVGIDVEISHEWEDGTGRYTLSVFICFSSRYCTKVSEKVAGTRARSCKASASPLYHYTSSHQTQLDSCRWHLVWRVWRLIEDVFDAGGIKANTLAFQTGVLLFEVSGQRRKAQVCSDQWLLTFQGGKYVWFKSMVISKLNFSSSWRLKYKC